MENLVTTNSGGKNITTSLKVAEIFGKRHDHVLRDIENLSCSDGFRLLNFGETPYRHPQNGQTYKSYEITKDGFSFLVMGYTGEKAGQFKEAFINEFNKREALLTNDDFIVSRALSILNERTKALEAENEYKTAQLQLANKTIKQQAPKVEAYETIYNAEGLIATTEIAKELGFSSAIAFNAYLKKYKIQHKVNECWVLNVPYSGNGYTQTKTTPYVDSKGDIRTSRSMYWTEKGRKFLHDWLRKTANK